MAEQMEICSPETPVSLNETRIGRNSLLLHKIANHLPAQTLGNLRRTCVEWNEAFVPVLKKRHRAVRLCSYPTPSEGTFNKFNRAMKDSKEIPFSKYVIGIRESEEQELSDFFSKCGPTITSLAFIFAGFDKICKFLTEWTSELVDLVIHPYPPEGSEEGSQKCQAIPREAFGQFPKLRSVHMYNGLPGADDIREILQRAIHLQSVELTLNGDDYFSTIRVLQDLQSVHKFKALRDFGLKPDLMQYLIALSMPNSPDQLRLERFQLPVHFTPLRPEQDAAQLHLLRTFLASQASSLLELDISFGLPADAKYDTTVAQIPKMEALTSFCLRRNPNWRLRFEEQTLGATFPALKHLEYTFLEGAKQADPGPFSLEELSQLPHAGVTNLVWNSALNFAALRSWFPAVTQVAFSIRTTDLPRLAFLWGHWPALQSLLIKYEPNDLGDPLNLDELLSGVRTSEHVELKRKLAEIDPAASTLETFRELQREYKTQAGIGDQKHLQKFTVELNQRGNVNLTDIGGYLGLAFAPPPFQFQIKMLKMTSAAMAAGGPWISAECIAFIRSTLGPFAVINV